MSISLILLLLATTGPAPTLEQALAHCRRQSPGDAVAQLACLDAMAKPMAGAEPPAVVGSAAVRPSAHGGREAWLSAQDDSRVSLGEGARLGGDERPEPLLYEAQLTTLLPWWDSEERRRCGPWRCWLDLSLRLHVRHLRGPSAPVRTPSYNPGLRLSVAPGREEGSGGWVYTLGLHHYSNGQEGEPYRRGLLNVVNGSFSTNYLELSALRWQGVRRAGSWWTGRATLQQHFRGSFEPYMRRQHAQQHLELEWRGGDHFVPWAGWQGQLRLRTSLRHGHRLRFEHESDPTLNQRLRTRDRLDLRADYLLKPEHWDLAWWLRYEVGMADYNIQFGRRVHRFMVGLALY